jgi:hypothetical protein
MDKIKLYVGLSARRLLFAIFRFLFTGHYDQLRPQPFHLSTCPNFRRPPQSTFRSKLAMIKRATSAIINRLQANTERLRDEAEARALQSFNNDPTLLCTPVGKGSSTGGDTFFHERLKHVLQRPRVRKPLDPESLRVRSAYR